MGTPVRIFSRHRGRIRARPKDEFYIYFLTNPIYIYHYLHDDNLTESPETRLTDDLDYFSRVLKRYEIVVPDRMIANVNADAVLNATDSV